MPFETAGTLEVGSWRVRVPVISAGVEEESCGVELASIK